MLNIYINVFLLLFVLIAVPSFLILKFFKTNNNNKYVILKAMLIVIITILATYKSYSDFSVMKEGYQKLISLKIDDIEYVRVQKTTKDNRSVPVLDKRLNRDEILTFIVFIKDNNGGYWTEKYLKNTWEFWIYLKGNEKILMKIDENNKIIFEPRYKNKSVGFYRNDNLKILLDELEKWYGFSNISKLATTNSLGIFFLEID